MTGQFKDHFSAHAQDYARFRPNYPPALFAWLAEEAPAQGLAWDAATGSGQAAHGLATHFSHVIATDASASQIENAASHANIEYRIEPAEEPTIFPASVDLITAGQALHWFDQSKFFQQALRVLKKRGVIAAWCYNLCRVAPEVDEVVLRLYRDIVGPYWPPERKLVESGYDKLKFPFLKMMTPFFAMEADWNAEQMLGYLGTWSATRRFMQERGSDPRAAVAADLARAWGPAGAARLVQWPLHLLVGRK